MQTFDINRFRNLDQSDQYERQLKRLRDSGKEVQSIEDAVRGAVDNLRADARSFVIYGEPQSGKTEMMICLTGKLIDEGYRFIVHLLNDSVDLLGQNLGRFAASGLSPAARNYTEILDPAVKVKTGQHVVFCKKNAKDLGKLIEKIGKMKKVVVIDDEADYASPNGKVNKGTRTKINGLINQILGDSGIYIGVTATPARLDLNNTFDNDSNLWVMFPPHSGYTGKEHFFPLSKKPIEYRLRLLPNSGDHARYAREALLSFLVNVAYLNTYGNAPESNYSILVHTSGKTIDHKADWSVMQATLEDLLDDMSNNFERYTKAIWDICRARYPDHDAERITCYILRNRGRHKLIVLNSERAWMQNSGAATNPTSLFTIIIGGNIVSRGVTLNNLLSMYFTRDVKHKLQQDTYIQRARMFGSRLEYFRHFELTIPEDLYADWRRCFVFHQLALEAIKSKRGSLVWLGDKRISAAASSSIDKSSVNLIKGEMSFDIFDCGPKVREELNRIAEDTVPFTAKVARIVSLIGEDCFPEYIRRYINHVVEKPSQIAFHTCQSIANYGASANKDAIQRDKGFFGSSQEKKFPDAEHHLFVLFNGQDRARLFYKQRSVTFMKNEAKKAA